MSKQPEALRLADWLEDQYDPTHNQEEAAAELRRLHGIEFALRDCEKTLEGMARKYMDAADQRDELRREWRGLTEEEITDGREQLPTEDLCGWSFRQGVEFAEAALKERNA